MSDQLIDGAERLFGDHVNAELFRTAEAGVFPAALWAAVTQAGYPAALLPEAAGGFGLPVPEAMRLLQVSASRAAPIPLAETMLAGFLLASAGLPVPEGPLTVAPVRADERVAATPTGDGWQVSGTVSRVPWGRDAATVAVLAMGPDGPAVAAVPGAACTVTRDRNLAGEPRITLRLDVTLPPEAVRSCGFGVERLRAAGAVLRTVQIAGALSRALSVSVGYAQTRAQFGRPIGKFQAIQQNLAVMAGQSAAAIAAADMAADAWATGLPPLPVAAAKARAGEAASIAAGIAHQVHGAIGFTEEYELHHATRRLWSWRDEFGNEAEWNAVVGRAALRAGADGLWPALTAAG